MGQLEKQVDTLQQEIDRSESGLERLNEEKPPSKAHVWSNSA